MSTMTEKPAPRLDPSSRFSISSSANATINQYLLENEPIYQELSKLRTAGWENQSGDTFFQVQRSRADNAGKNGKAHTFLPLMQKICYDMNVSTGALGPRHNRNMRALDLCMAPGGYSSGLLAHNPFATVDAISLPYKDGGHKVLIPFGHRDKRVKIQFADITMFAAEFGVPEIPHDHPDFANFLGRPDITDGYDLAFCDGQVLRGHDIGEHRQNWEATRLTNSQLIIALQHLKSGGTMVVLLHKAEVWDTVLLLRAFNSFAEVSTFKPSKAHAIRSSFYMVAKNIRSESEEAKKAVDLFRRLWYRGTFGPSGPIEDDFPVPTADEIIADFGERLRELGRGVWEIQKVALEKAPFINREPANRVGAGQGTE